MNWRKRRRRASRLISSLSPRPLGLARRAEKMLLDDLRLYELMVTAGHDAMAAGLLSALRQGQIVDVLAHEESRPVLAHLPRGPTSGPEPYDLDGAGDEDLSRVRGLVLADKKTASILEPLETKVPKAASSPPRPSRTRVKLATFWRGHQFKRTVVDSGCLALQRAGRDVGPADAPHGGAWRRPDVRVTTRA